MPKQVKVDAVAGLKDRIGKASALYFIDFTKLAANDFNVLRRKLGESKVTVRVVKNRLTVGAEFRHRPHHRRTLHFRSGSDRAAGAWPAGRALPPPIAPARASPERPAQGSCASSSASRTKSSSVL